MFYENKKVKDLKIAYVGGGSTNWAWTFMSDLALDDQISGTMYLYDIDYELAEKNAHIGNSLKDRDEAVGDWTYKASHSLEEAITDADFVVISILPGSFDEMASDVHYPEKYGIYQSVGDTSGPGGMIRTLRSIPMMKEIALAVKAYAPDSWVINYTNPMSTLTGVLYEVFPEIKAFGCCHEVFGTQEMLADIVGEALGTKNVQRQDIQVNVLGINHFTWFDYASYKGVDVFPIYNKYIDEHKEEGYGNPEEHWMNSSFDSKNLVKFDLFKKYGLIASAGDRHLVEFMPHDLYLTNEETVENWGFGLTSIEWRKNDLKNRLEKVEQLYNGEVELEIKDSGEEGILLIKALCGLERVISNVNIPNYAGQIDNLPKSAIVETNALFERDAIRPVFAGSIPDQVFNLILPHVDNHERIIKAALDPNVELVVEAFKHDPLINQSLSDDEIDDLVLTMIENTLTYLPIEWQEEIKRYKAKKITN